MEFGKSLSYTGFGDEGDPLWFQPISPTVRGEACETSVLRDNMRSAERSRTEPSYDLYPWSKENVKEDKNVETVKGKHYKLLPEVELLDPFGLGIPDVKLNKEPFFVPAASSPSILPTETPGPPPLMKECNHRLQG